MEEERFGRKRLSVDIPTAIYKNMKISTVNRNCTITKWVIRAIIDRLKKEAERME
jgi:hypothetical protein